MKKSNYFSTFTLLTLSLGLMAISAFSSILFNIGIRILSFSYLYHEKAVACIFAIIAGALGWISVGYFFAKMYSDSKKTKKTIYNWK